MATDQTTTTTTPSPPQPKIHSLQNYRVYIPDDVQHHLESQYESLHQKEQQQLERSTNQNNNDNNRKYVPPLERLIHAMKYPPSLLTCRVNLIHSNIDDAIEQLEKSEVFRTTNNDDDDDDDGFWVKRHDVLKDVILVGHSSLYSPSSTITKSSLTVPASSSSDDDAPLLFPKWQKRSEKQWPMTHRVVICDRMCGEAVLRGSNIYAVGVLCADVGITVGESVAVYADIDNKMNSHCHEEDDNHNIKKLTRGCRVEDYGNTCVYLGVGHCHLSRNEMFQRKCGLAISMSFQERCCPVILPSINELCSSSGVFMAQNLPSIMVGHVLNPQCGDVILDMCCAPGGKTCHVASLMWNNNNNNNNDDDEKGIVVACDKSRKKVVNASRGLFRRMACGYEEGGCVVPLALDATRCVLSDDVPWRSVKEVISTATKSQKDNLHNIQSFHPRSFDKIILDPPCSALGLRPKLHSNLLTKHDLLKFPTYQRKFISPAISLLKPGGIMTYSTCTIHCEENEGMVRYILDEFHCMELLSIDIDHGGVGLEGVGLDDEERRMVRRFDPVYFKDHHEEEERHWMDDTMGFFIAKFRKRDS